MSKAQELLEEKELQENFLILADKQRMGQGRKGNIWYSPEGGLWFTLAIYGFKFNSNFTIFLGIQVHKALITMFPQLQEQELLLKWPNDIYLKEKKLAGIIVKQLSYKEYYFCGIGINTAFEGFPDELASHSISLKNSGIISCNNEDLLKTILDNISDNLPEYLVDSKFSRSYYDKYDFLRNREITITTDFSQFQGKYRGINQEGALLLKLESGAIQPFYAGEVNFNIVKKSPQE
ncbi:MAG: biotin--[acetyl-CoA-carboxylase] ligase [Candidatus Cloacimonetes bacterium]|nr:biotin--[acetyl-CoA-carboxylase] ligase [Candidatus Cloacimonadota bacterium]